MKDYPHNMKLERFSLKSKLKASELLKTWLMFMANLFGAAVLACGTLILGLLLLLFQTVNWLGTFLLVLSRGPQTYLQNKVLRVLSYVETLLLKKF